MAEDLHDCTFRISAIVHKVDSYLPAESRAGFERRLVLRLPSLPALQIRPRGAARGWGESTTVNMTAQDMLACIHAAPLAILLGSADGGGGSRMELLAMAHVGVSRILTKAARDYEGQLLRRQRIAEFQTLEDVGMGQYASVGADPSEEEAELGICRDRHGRVVVPRAVGPPRLASWVRLEQHLPLFDPAGEVAAELRLLFTLDCLGSTALNNSIATPVKVSTASLGALLGDGGGGSAEGSADALRASGSSPPGVDEGGGGGGGAPGSAPWPSGSGSASGSVAALCSGKGSDSGSGGDDDGSGDDFSSALEGCGSSVPGSGGGAAAAADAADAAAAAAVAAAAAADAFATQMLAFRVVSENGAKLRAGAELSTEERGVAVPKGTVVFVDQKVTLDSGSERLHVVSPQAFAGWISGKPALVEAVPEDEVPRPAESAPRAYRVVAENGAKRREGCELDSAELGAPIPRNTVITAGRMQLASNGSARLEVVAPAQWRGWVSDKPSVLQAIAAQAPAAARRFRVVSANGAKRRAQCALDSAALQPPVPTGTVLEVGAAQEAPDGSERLQVVAPMEWTGWISNKASIVQELRRVREGDGGDESDGSGGSAGGPFAPREAGDMSAAAGDAGGTPDPLPGNNRSSRGAFPVAYLSDGGIAVRADGADAESPCTPLAPQRRGSTKKVHLRHAAASPDLAPAEAAAPKALRGIARRSGAAHAHLALPQPPMPRPIAFRAGGPPFDGRAAAPSDGGGQRAEAAASPAAERGANAGPSGADGGETRLHAPPAAPPPPSGVLMQALAELAAPHSAQQPSVLQQLFLEVAAVAAAAGTSLPLEPPAQPLAVPIHVRRRRRRRKKRRGRGDEGPGTAHSTSRGGGPLSVEATATDTPIGGEGTAASRESIASAFSSTPPREPPFAATAPAELQSGAGKETRQPGRSGASLSLRSESGERSGHRHRRKRSVVLKGEAKAKASVPVVRGATAASLRGGVDLAELGEDGLEAAMMAHRSGRNGSGSGSGSSSKGRSRSGGRSSRSSRSDGSISSKMSSAAESNKNNRSSAVQEDDGSGGESVSSNSSRHSSERRGSRRSTRRTRSRSSSGRSASSARSARSGRSKRGGSGSSSGSDSSSRFPPSGAATDADQVAKLREWFDRTAVSGRIASREVEHGGMPVPQDLRAALANMMGKESADWHELLRRVSEAEALAAMLADSTSGGASGGASVGAASPMLNVAVGRDSDEAEEEYSTDGFHSDANTPAVVKSHDSGAWGTGIMSPTDAVREVAEPFDAGDSLDEVLMATGKAVLSPSPGVAPEGVQEVEEEEEDYASDFDNESDIETLELA